MTDPFFRTLAKDAASLYPVRERYARHFASGKLLRDPAFSYILRTGLVPSRARVLDLGCGQGVLAALLVAAEARHRRREWHPAWPAPPELASFTGIDLMQRDVDRAMHVAAQAPAGAMRFVAADIRTASLDACDVVVILDVLHYVDFEAQGVVLGRVRAALNRGGVLLLRVADESPSLRFRYTLAIDRLMMALRGHRFERHYCKPLARWTAELQALGFRVESTPMSAGTPFANVLLVARYDGRG
ncbi:MAG TPA: class I SAM-dependent methyltransferase [Usitatibacter sp.]|nr:class I SAM-dependent methyltransferase [Usitatibacter sp.]